MTRPETKQNEERIDSAKLKEFLEKLAQDFAKRDFSQLSSDQALLMANMSQAARKYLAALLEIQKEQEELKKADPKSESFNKKQEAVEKKLKDLVEEASIIAFASGLPIGEVLKFQKDHGLDINKFGKSGYNPLIAALASGRSLEDLQKILQNGANINAKSPKPEENSVAHFAVMFGVKPKTMDFLIKQGANVNAVNGFGLTPLDMAMMKGSKDLAEVLKENGAKLGRVTISKEEEKGRGRKKDEKKDGDKKEKEDLKKAKEAEKKEIAAEKKEAEEQRLARLQEQAAQTRIAMELSEESKHKAKEKLEKDSQKQKIEFGFSVKSEEARPAEKLPEPIQKVVDDSSKKSSESLQLKAEPVGAIEKLLKILGIEKTEGVNFDRLLASSARRGEVMISAFFISCGGNPNSKEVLKAAIEGGNHDLISMVASRCDPKIVSDSIISIGSKIVKEALEVVLKEKPESAKADANVARILEEKALVAKAELVQERQKVAMAAKAEGADFVGLRSEVSRASVSQEAQKVVVAERAKEKDFSAEAEKVKEKDHSDKAAGSEVSKTTTAQEKRKADAIKALDKEFAEARARSSKDNNLAEVGAGSSKPEASKAGPAVKKIPNLATEEPSTVLQPKFVQLLAARNQSRVAARAA